MKNGNRPNVSESTMGQRIKTARTNLKISQLDLAEMIGVRKQAISNYEADRRDIKVSVLKDIAKALHVSASYLIEDTDEQEDGSIHEEVSEISEILSLLRDMDAKTLDVALEQIRVLSKLRG